MKAKMGNFADNNEKNKGGNKRVTKVPEGTGLIDRFKMLLLPALQNELGRKRNVAKRKTKRRA